MGEGVPRSRPTAIKLLYKAGDDGKAQVPVRLAGFLEHPTTPRFASDEALENAFQAQMDAEYRKAYPGGQGGSRPGACSNGSSSVRADMNGGCPVGFDTHGGMDSR